jgi:hypothetical protein
MSTNSSDDLAAAPPDTGNGANRSEPRIVVDVVLCPP